MRALSHNQRGVKLLAVLLAIASLASSMQLLVAKDRTQQSTAAARHQLDEGRDVLAREEGGDSRCGETDEGVSGDADSKGGCK